MLSRVGVYSSAGAKRTPITLPLASARRTVSSTSEWSWAYGPPIEMKVAVILSEAKDLQFRPKAN